MPSPTGRAISRRGLLTALGGATAALGAGPALAGCGLLRSGPDYPRTTVQLATGSDQGVYYRYGTEFAKVIRRELDGLQTDVLQTAGSVENVRKVGTNPSAFGMVAADAAIDAVEGAGVYLYDPRPLRALARVYDDYMHLIVRAESPIDSMTELRGKIVSIGSPNSGVALIATRLLDLIDINAQLDPGIRKLGLATSISELRAGRLDALFWSGGLPTFGITDLVKTLPVRMIPIGEYAADMGSDSGYRAATAPSNIYENNKSFTTIAVPNYLLTTDRTDEGLAYQLTRLLFEFRDELAARLPLAGFLDVRGAIETGKVQLHPGAQRYYSERKP